MSVINLYFQGLLAEIELCSVYVLCVFEVFVFVALLQNILLKVKCKLYNQICFFCYFDFNKPGGTINFPVAKSNNPLRSSSISVA